MNALISGTYQGRFGDCFSYALARSLADLLLYKGADFGGKFTLNGRSVRSRIAANSVPMASGLSIAQGNEPRPPALDTATVSSLPWTPAIGGQGIARFVAEIQVGRRP
jgi:hypothetical protein